MNLRELDDVVTLSNGAILQKTSEDCDVCIAKDQEIEQSTFILEYEGKQIHLCDAHTELLLYMDQDEQERKKGWPEWLGDVERNVKDE